MSSHFVTLEVIVISADFKNYKVAFIKHVSCILNFRF